VKTLAMRSAESVDQIHPRVASLLAATGFRFADGPSFHIFWVPESFDPILAAKREFDPAGKDFLPIDCQNQVKSKGLEGSSSALANESSFHPVALLSCSLQIFRVLTSSISMSVTLPPLP
jgi:hypothetical protein